MNVSPDGYTNNSIENFFFAWSAEDVGGRLRGKAERAGGESGVLIKAAKIKNGYQFQNQSYTSMCLM
jgi:hypothetical protein